MTKEHYKRITLTLHELSKDMLEVISRETKLTKSEIMQQLLKDYTLSFWGDDYKRIIEGWKKYANTKK